MAPVVGENETGHGARKLAVAEHATKQDGCAQPILVSVGNRSTRQATDYPLVSVGYDGVSAAKLAVPTADLRIEGPWGA